jgi:hypothetical protein
MEFIHSYRFIDLKKHGMVSSASTPIRELRTRRHHGQQLPHR